VPLQRAYRLRKNSDFQRVKQQGRRITSRLLSLAWSENNEQALRIGFVVSKRISKHAVTRNYIKRLLSEAMRPILAELPCGYDMVISVKNQIVTLDTVKRTQLVASPSVITLELRTLLRRTHLLVSPSRASEASV
jgi:ribonuclease P protein component